MTSSTYSPQRWVDVEVIKVQPNTIGIKSTANAGTTTNIDQKINDDSLLRAIGPIIQNSNFGDTIDIYIIDKDGVYFPSNTVVSHPVQSYYVQTSQQIQQTYESIAPFKILGGLYVRFAYVNTNALVAATVAINLQLLTVQV